jgi:4-hydroxy-3-polyprenylbenzoate decarboxylase
LVNSEAGKTNIPLETEYRVSDVVALADRVYDEKDLAASLASGSFLMHGMVVIPCSIKTLSGIAHSYTENLLVRAADVTLKEKRKLVLVVRETPLHLGHLCLLTQAAEMGAMILPPVPSFYHQPKTIEDLIDQTIAKGSLPPSPSPLRQMRPGWNWGADEFWREVLAQMDGKMGRQQGEPERRESAEKGRKSFNEELKRREWDRKERQRSRKADSAKLQVVDPLTRRIEAPLWPRTLLWRHQAPGVDTGSIELPRRPARRR